ncbi:MAG: LamG domain-containing protein [Sedimenticola sp.]|nr:LamG domain-containing protein [Sedimenticola sp.]
MATQTFSTVCKRYLSWLSIQVVLIALVGVLSVPASVQAATLIAQFHMEDNVWSGAAGELTDSAGYVSGPYNGLAIGASPPSPSAASSARSGDPGTCGYATLPGPVGNGGAFSIANLPVSVAPGAKTSVAFWMYWDGSNSVMPIGWYMHDLWLTGGYFGFNTGNGDVYGISSAGLANGWHHVTAVFTNGSVTSNQLYIDGLIQTLTQRQSSPTNSRAVVTSTLRIGGWQVNNSYRFSGRIDEVNVFNGAVSVGEVATLYGGTHACPVPPVRPMAEWRFDELAGNTAFDESGGGYHGTAVGSVTVGATGKLCSSYTYGGGYVTLPSSFPNHTTGVSITGWFKPSNVSTPGQRIFADDEHNSGGYAVSLGDPGSGRVRFFSRGPRPISLDSAAVINPNNWYFVAAVADTSAKTKRLYLYDASGNLLDSKIQSWTGNWGIDAGVPSVGGETDASAESSFRFQGEIDELKIFNVPLSAAEIATGYTNENSGKSWDGTARSCPVLIADYRMETGGWNGTAGELKDTAGYATGPYDGQAIGSSVPFKSTVSPAKTGNPGTCDYATLPGSVNNGGAFSISGLPVSVTPGAETSVAFWMYWNGTDSVMPIGWSRHDLWLRGGNFGFNTANSDVYGISSSGLANGWHHVTAVFTNGSVTSNKLYIDGVDQTLTQRLSTPNNSQAVVSSTLRIGGWQASNGYRFSGRIDEVKVYNGAVNQALVTALYTETHPCPASTPPVLVGLWRSDETGWDGTAGEVIDGSGYGHNGTAINGVTTSKTSSARTGDPGTCSYGLYDGQNDYVSVSHTNALNPDSFSVSLWARVDGGSGTWRSPITSRGSSGADRYGYNLYAGTDNRWQFWTGTGGTAGNTWNILTGPAVTGGWTHIVATFEKGSDAGSGTWRGTKRLYINGSLVATNANAYYRPMNSGYAANLTIGAGGQNGSSYRFNGAVDEVRVYNGVIDNSAVAALYAETHPCPASTDAFAFNCIESGADALTGKLYTKLVGQPFVIDVAALRDANSDGTADAVETDFAKDADRTVSVELIDTSTAATCATYPALSPAVSQNLLFTAADAGRKAAASYTVSKAYRSLGCRVTDSTTTTPVVGCSTDQFAIRPQSISLVTPALNNSGSSGTPTAVAGSIFTLQADSDDGYDGTPLIDGGKLEAHAGAVAIGTLSGSFSAASSSNGTATGTAFSYSEVGNFRLLAEGIYDDGFTAVDQSGDCTNDFSNSPVAGKVGCKFGNTAVTDWVGRFIPADFTLVITDQGVLENSCLAGGFSYAGTPIGYAALQAPAATIMARNSAGVTTQNYTGIYSKLSASDINLPNITTDGTQLGVDGLNKVGLNWSVGVPDWTDNGNGTFSFALSGDAFTYARTANDLVAPFTSDVDLTVQSITDSDGVTGVGLPQTFSPTGVPVRFGRLAMQNAQGSELLPLNVPLQAEYYSGAAGGFAANVADLCTQVNGISLVDLDGADGVIATTAPTRNTAVYAPAVIAGGYAASDLSDATLLFTQPPVGGDFNLNLQPPGQGNTGSAQVVIDAPTWLEYSWSGAAMSDPSAKATFGVFSRPSSLIYRRENTQ